jgi:hypothetical protein
VASPTGNAARICPFTLTALVVSVPLDVVLSGDANLTTQCHSTRTSISSRILFFQLEKRVEFKIHLKKPCKGIVSLKRKYRKTPRIQNVSKSFPREQLKTNWNPVLKC